METADPRIATNRYARFKQRLSLSLLAKQINQRSPGDQLPFEMEKH